MRDHLFDRDGYVRLPVKTGDEPYKPYKQGDCPERVRMCLECTKQCCKNGTCKELRRVKNKEDKNNDAV